MFKLLEVLSSEPEKKESFVLAIFKLLLTIWVVSNLLKIDLLSNSIVQGQLPKELTLGSIVKYVSAFILTWFTIWKILGEYLISLVTYLLTKIGTGRNIFITQVGLWKLAKTKRKSIIGPSKNTLISLSLIELISDSQTNSSDNRLDVYIPIGTLALIVLWVEQMIPSWAKCLALILLILAFINHLNWYKLEKYVRTNKTKLLDEFSIITFMYYLKKILFQTEEVLNDFKIVKRGRKISLSTRTKAEIQQNYYIHTRYFNDKREGRRLLLKELRQYKSNTRTNANVEQILWTNIKLVEDELQLLDVLEVRYVYLEDNDFKNQMNEFVENIILTKDNITQSTFLQ